MISPPNHFLNQDSNQDSSDTVSLVQSESDETKNKVKKGKKKKCWRSEVGFDLSGSGGVRPA